MTPFYLEPLYYAFVALVAVCAWGAGFLWSKSEIAALQKELAAMTAGRARAILKYGDEITANSRLRAEVARLEAQLKEQEAA